jgi:hypothetical protein
MKITKKALLIKFHIANNYIDSLIIRIKQLNNFNAKPIKEADLVYLKNILKETGEHEDK